MILEKSFNSEKYAEFVSLARPKKYGVVIQQNRITFETEDADLIDFIESNFEDYVDVDLRLDALEAQIIGEQSTFSKIREVLKI